MIPLYGYTISSKASIVISGNTLLVPIENAQPNSQLYFAFNLNEFSSKMLQAQLKIPFQQFPVIVVPIINIYNAPIFNSRVAMALTLSDLSCSLFYMNERADFVFTLLPQFYFSKVQHLAFLIEQPFTSISYIRNYTIYYQFRDTKIYSIRSSQRTISLKDVSIRAQDNYYLYLLLVNVTAQFIPGHLVHRTNCWICGNNLEQ